MRTRGSRTISQGYQIFQKGDSIKDLEDPSGTFGGAEDHSSEVVHEVEGVFGISSEEIMEPIRDHSDNKRAQPDSLPLEAIGVKKKPKIDIERDWESLRRRQEEEYIQVSGRLAHFEKAWAALGDTWALGIVKNGIRLDLLQWPRTWKGRSFYLDTKNQTQLDEEIRDFDSKGAIEEIRKPGMVSPLFVIPKKNGRFRAVHNLRMVNTFIRKETFRIEDIRTVRNLVEHGD